jgi:hypothetical protein
MSDASDEAKGFTYEDCTNFSMSGCHARKPEPENVTIDGDVYNNSNANSNANANSNSALSVDPE